MKHTLHTLLAACILATLACGNATAKKSVAPRMYMFGLAASFTDSVVYITNIQQVDSAWIETKNKFLLGREHYSYQLRDYLDQKEQMPFRTCITVYHQDQKKLAKKYARFLRLYTQPKKGMQHFDVRHLTQEQFAYQAVNMSDYDDEAAAQVAKPAKKKEHHGMKRLRKTEKKRGQ